MVYTFLVMFLSGFGMLPSQNKMRSIQVFERIWEGSGVLITDSICLLVTGVFRLCISLWLLSIFKKFWLANNSATFFFWSQLSRCQCIDSSAYIWQFYGESLLLGHFHMLAIASFLLTCRRRLGYITDHLGRGHIAIKL